MSTNATRKYSITVPTQTENMSFEADICTVDGLLDLQFAYEDEDKTRLIVVRNPVNVIVQDNDFPKPISELKEEMEEFMKKKTETFESMIESQVQQLLKKQKAEEKLLCYQ